MVDVHSTQVLNRVIDNLPDRTNFLVDTFFPGVDVSEEETILFDTTNGRKLITPFVSPLAEGKIIQSLGYETDSLRPAYTKDRRFFDPKKGSKRIAGEKIGGELTQAERVDRAIKWNLNEALDMQNGRFECMAGEVLMTGKSTITGEDYPTRVVDFKRRLENTVVLTGADRWTATPTVKPWERIDNEAQELSDATGFAPTDVIFSPEAWVPFYADAKANHKDEIDKDLENGGLTEIMMGYINQPRDGVVYRGRSGYLRFWTYSGTYTNPETMQTIRPLPAGGVIMGGASIDGVRHFGAIQDFEAGIQARQYFTKSKLHWNPSRWEYLTQSAPLLVPYRRNNVKSLTVL